MAGNIEGDQTVAASLAAVTQTKALKVLIQETPEAAKTDRSAGTRSLIVTEDREILAKQPTRESISRPTKILLQVLGTIKLQVLPQLKSAALSRQVKPALRVKATRQSRLPVIRPGHVKH